MSISVIFIDIDEKYREFSLEKLLKETVQKTLQLNRVMDAPSLSIRVTDDGEIRDLNFRYRGLNRPTDVLSFSADYLDPDLETRYLGDVVISYSQASDQAERRGHPVASELQLLVVHGVLHLLGFDHGTPEEKKAMWDIQRETLEALGLDIQVEDESIN